MDSRNDGVQQEFFFDLEAPVSLFRQYMRDREEAIRNGTLVLVKYPRK